MMGPHDSVESLGLHMGASLLDQSLRRDVWILLILPDITESLQAEVDLSKHIFSSFLHDVISHDGT